MGRISAFCPRVLEKVMSALDADASVQDCCSMVVYFEA